ncbi:hypothetical protein [Akkermansia muciniphila]|uniref:hypothetical protein n=1 Tax=Akkermansia muciniphila TaxID=239935 RepID=UPI0004F3709E|nr:hypothetical protein [Akkermansia muciniphila]
MSGPCLVRTVAIFILFSSFSLLHAKDEEFSNIMELVSETENCSAKLARDKNATEEQKKEDRKRRKIGIGETVTVTLNCKKPFLLEPKEQIQWKVMEGKELLEGGLEKIPNNYQSIRFKINPYVNKEQIQQSGKIVIKVETEQGIALPRPIEFDVIFPRLLTAEHETLGGKVKGLPALAFDFPRDGDRNQELRLSLLFPSILWMYVLKEFGLLKRIKDLKVQSEALEVLIKQIVSGELILKIILVLLMII